MPTIDLTLQLARNSRPAQRDLFLFDQDLPGFGLRIHPSGRKVWIVQARIEGRTRRMVIARHDEMALPQARRRAREILERVRADNNPANDARRARIAHYRRVRLHDRRQHRGQSRRHVRREPALGGTLLGHRRHATPPAMPTWPTITWWLRPSTSATPSPK